MNRLLIQLSIMCLLEFAFIIRNNAVYTFRNTLIDKVFRDPDYPKKRESFRKVTYHEMLWKFWRPLKEEEWYGNLLD